MMMVYIKAIIAVKPSLTKFGGTKEDLYELHTSPDDIKDIKKVQLKKIYLQ